MNDEVELLNVGSSGSHKSNLMKIVFTVIILIFVIFIAYQVFDLIGLRRFNMRDPFPPFTQITVSNGSNKSILVRSIRFGDHVDRFNRRLAAQGRGKTIVDYQFVYFRRQSRYRQEIEVVFQEDKNMTNKTEVFIADRRNRNECKFVLSFIEIGARLSECQKPDTEDLR